MQLTHALGEIRNRSLHRDVSGHVLDPERVQRGEVDAELARECVARARGSLAGRTEAEMTTKVLFLQGGGKDAHAWDAKLARSLADKLGPGYTVAYPEMPNEADPNYEAWRRCILEQRKALGEGVVLVGHSLGGSMLLKMLAEGDLGEALRGVFIISAPYFHETEGWPWPEAQMPANAASRFPAGLALFLYHGQDDDDVPFSHLALQAKALPQAQTRALAGRNHQLNDDLTEVADDIRKLAP